MRAGSLARIVCATFLTVCLACAPEPEAAPSPAPETAPAAAKEETAPTTPDSTPDAIPDGKTITVAISNFRNSEGLAQVTLYDREDEFLSEDSATAQKVRVEIEGEKATAEFAGIQPGNYAIALMHDEDGDGEMKKNLIGIPKEGIGMSNDAKPKFGPPKWEDAVFEVGEEDVSLTIAMFYM